MVLQETFNDRGIRVFFFVYFTFFLLMAYTEKSLSSLSPDCNLIQVSSCVHHSKPSLYFCFPKPFCASHPDLLLYSCLHLMSVLCCVCFAIAVCLLQFISLTLTRQKNILHIIKLPYCYILSLGARRARICAINSY